MWALFGLTALAVFVTYWRLPAEELFRTSFEGLEAGASRALVLLNFPISLVAIAIVGVLLERGANRVADAERGGSRGLGIDRFAAERGVGDEHGDRLSQLA